MKTIEINGRLFKVVNPKTQAGEHIRHIALTKCNTYYYYDDIFKAYKRPSSTKVIEWNYWNKWFDGIKADNKEIWIPSRNTWQFTIAFKFKTLMGYKVIGYITKTRNEVIIYE